MKSATAKNLGPYFLEKLKRSNKLDDVTSLDFYYVKPYLVM